MKSKLMRNNYSNTGLATQWLGAGCAYEFDYEYVVVGSHSGPGIPDLCEFVGEDII